MPATAEKDHARTCYSSSQDTQRPLPQRLLLKAQLTTTWKKFSYLTINAYAPENKGKNIGPGGCTPFKLRLGGAFDLSVRLLSLDGFHYLACKSPLKRSLNGGHPPEPISSPQLG